MRKSLKLFLLMICLIPLALLSACGITQYYTISTISSSLDFGTANGGSLSAMAEGTEVTLTASEKKPETNPFVCWIKDNSQIVSFDKSYSMTYSANTNGKYTALFQESLNTINKTRYVTISNVEITNVDSGNLKINYAYSSNTQNKILLEDLTIENGTTTTEKKNLLYFGTDNEIKFNLYATLSITNGSAVTTTTISFDEILVDYYNNLAGTGNYVTFDDEGNCTIESKPNIENIVVKITFSKLNLGLYNQVDA